MVERLNVGIVGARRGTALVGGIRARENVEVVALCDIDEDRLTERADDHGIPNRFTDFDRMLESDVNLIFVATPLHLHVPQTLAALSAGKHVMSEVTAAVSVDQCRELLSGVERARKSGLRYMMAENTCFSPNNLIIGKMVQEGLFGEIYFAEGEYVHEIRSLHYDAEGVPTWRSEWQVGVNGCTYGTHSLGPVLEWFGERVESVVCVGSGRHTAPEHEAEDMTTMLCKTASGALIKICVDILSNRPHGGGYFSLQGTKGCYESARGLGDKPKIWLDGFGRTSANRETIDADPYEWRPLEEYQEKFLPDLWMEAPPEALASGHGGTDFFVVGDIVSAIREDREPNIDVNRALDFTLPGLMSQISIADGGRPVKAQDFRAGHRR